MLVTAYANGTTAGSPPPPREHLGGPRGEVKGWSQDAVRRHTKWLYSIDAPALSGQGFAVTLTVRDLPSSSEDWKRVRERFFVRMRRQGLDFGHWLTEWQERGCPHMHGALYFPAGMDEQKIIGAIYAAWLEVAAEFRPGWQSQLVEPIDGPTGWLQYLSKHASRGVRHYQRQGKPPGWVKTGRLWGVLGEWPEIAPLKFDMPTGAYHRYRRLMRSWRVADARQELVDRLAHPSSDQDVQQKRVRLARRRLSVARRMLACPDPRLSPVRGISEWAGESVSFALLGLLVDEDFPVVQRQEKDL